MLNNNCKPSFFNSGLCWSWIIVVAVLFDQITKRMAISYFDFNHATVVNSFLNVTLVKNPGAAFSFLADGLVWQFWLLVTFNIFMVLLLFYWLCKSNLESHLYNIGLVFIISGAIGNLIDRFNYGAVIDFIDIHVFGFHWPIFNVADITITLGAVFYLLATRKPLDK